MVVYGLKLIAATGNSRPLCEVLRYVYLHRHIFAQPLYDKALRQQLLYIGAVSRHPR